MLKVKVGVDVRAGPRLIWEQRPVEAEPVQMVIPVATPPQFRHLAGPTKHGPHPGGTPQTVHAGDEPAKPEIESVESDKPLVVPVEKKHSVKELVAMTGGFGDVMNPERAAAADKRYGPQDIDGKFPKPEMTPDTPAHTDPYKLPPPIKSVADFITDWAKSDKSYIPEYGEAFKYLLESAAAAVDMTPDQYIQGYWYGVTGDVPYTTSDLFNLRRTPREWLEVSKTKGKGDPETGSGSMDTVDVKADLADYVMRTYGDMEFDDHARAVYAGYDAIRRKLPGGAESIFRKNGKTVLSVDFSSDCPYRRFKGENPMGNPCWQCYVENPRVAEELGFKQAGPIPPMSITIENRTYNRQMLLGMNRETIDMLNDLGGLRCFSSGDWSEDMDAEFGQFVSDAESIGLNLRVITKMPKMVEKYGDRENVFIDISTDFEHFFLDEDRISRLPEKFTDVIKGFRQPTQTGVKGMLSPEAHSLISNAMTIDEAFAFQKKNPEHVRVRYLAIDPDDAYRAAQDPRVSVVTMYHGTFNNVAGQQKIAAKVLKETQDEAENWKVYKPNKKAIDEAVLGWFKELPPLTTKELGSDETGKRVAYVFDRSKFGDDFVQYVRTFKPELIQKVSEEDLKIIGFKISDQKMMSAKMTAIVLGGRSTKNTDNAGGPKNIHELVSMWVDMGHAKPVFKTAQGIANLKAKMCCVSGRCLTCKVNCGYGPEATKQWMSLIDDNMRRAAEGRPLASVEFMNDGRALIKMFRANGVVNMVHEVGHVFRRQLKVEDRQIAERWAGVKDGYWGEEHEEKFANGFELYLAQGKAPAPEMDGVFGQFKGWLRKSFDRFNGKIEISPEMRGVYDRFLKSKEVAVEVAKVAQAEQKQVKLVAVKKAKVVKAKVVPVTPQAQVAA